MIIREWGATVTVDREKDYLSIVRRLVLPALAGHQGYQGATFARRSDGEHVRYQVISYWASWQAIQDFAGSDPEVAYIPDEIVATLEDFDRSVRHYEVEIGHELQRLSD